MVHVRGDLFFGVKKLYQKGPIFACPIPPARFCHDILHREVGIMGHFLVFPKPVDIFNPKCNTE